MDTRFWGPSGWRLLHLITFSCQPEKTEEFFTMLPFVLPCKFCRASLSEYMEKDPINISSKRALSQWLWRIHNKVNEKLRSQGLLKYKNPSFHSVEEVYKDRIAAGCIRTEFEGWEFLFSIAENHPFSKMKSLPMPGAPPQAETPELRNRWNLMKPDERMPYYERFWKSVEEALPFSEWREAWKKCDLQMRLNKSEFIKNLWKVRCCLETKLELVNHEEFHSLCKRLADHKSGCSAKKRAKTCRRTRKK